MKRNMVVAEGIFLICLLVTYTASASSVAPENQNINHLPLLPPSDEVSERQKWFLDYVQEIADYPNLSDASELAKLLQSQLTTILAKDNATSMVGFIADTATAEHAGLFHRFALMKQWAAAQSFAAFVTPDGLHLNDAGYGCWAVNLAFGIENAARRPIPHIAETRKTSAVP